MYRGFLVTVLLQAMASIAAAQPIIDEDRLPTPWVVLETDLNADGQPDTLTAAPHSLDLDIVTVELGLARAPIVIPIWKNLTGEPGIVLTSPSTFDLRTGCFACGRYHSETLWRLAWRKGALIVAGYRDLSVDRLEAKVTICDVNLRTGRAEITVDSTLVETHVFEPPTLEPRDLLAWSGPEVCRQVRD